MIFPMLALMIALVMGVLSAAAQSLTNGTGQPGIQTHEEGAHDVAPVGAAWPTTLRDDLGIEFVLIPAGEFVMGSTVDDLRQLVSNYQYALKRDWIIDEAPRHQVRISRPFYLSKYEITQRQWEAVMGANPSRFKEPNRPVERVSWEDIRLFIHRLNTREPGAGYRLPTEAEWEYAARGSDARWYPWGHTLDANRFNCCDRNCNQAWRDQTSNDGYGFTAPVGSYQNGVSPFGVHDMVGNVWEWVEDRYGLYTMETVTDPQGPASGEFRVVRGGSWDNNAGLCRVAARLHVGPHHRFDFLGFRLARTVP